MKRSNRLVILVGVLLAVLAFVAIVILLNQQEPTGPGPDAEPETMSVLVASSAIEIGQVVTPADVEERDIPVAAAQTGVLIDSSQLADRTALTELPAGAQVTEALFGDSRTVDIEGQLLPGEKAMAIQVDRVTGLNFLLAQGDVVDVIIAFDFPAGAVPGGTHLDANDTETLRSVRTLLQAKRVLYISDTNIPGPPTVDENGNEIPPADPNIEGNIIVVLAGSDQDAELLTFAQRSANEVGTITLTLRGTDNADVEATTGVTLFGIFDTYGLVLPEAITELIPEGDEATE